MQDLETTIRYIENIGHNLSTLYATNANFDNLDASHIKITANYLKRYVKDLTDEINALEAIAENR